MAFGAARARRRAARLAGAASLVLGLGPACARFGFERLVLDDDGGAGARPGAGGATAGRGGEGGASGEPDAGASGEGGASGASSGGASSGGTSGGGTSSGGTSGGGTSSGGGPSLPEDGGVSDPDGDAGEPAADCSDGEQNGAESGVDCGGSCPPCACDLGVPERLGDPNYPGNDLWSPRLSADGRTLYFGLTIPGLNEQVAVATRPDRSAPFGLGQPLPAPVNQSKEGTPHPSLDGLSLYFYSERGGASSRDLYVATRASAADSFGAVTLLSGVNGPELDYLPWLSDDELTLYFTSGPAGAGDILRATRASRGAAFGAPAAVSELNTPSDEGGITLSSDGLEAILSTNRLGGAGARDLYRATRARLSDPFESPAPLDGLNSGANELDPSISPDGRELYFVSNRDGDSAIYRAARTCPP